MSRVAPLVFGAAALLVAGAVVAETSAPPLSCRLAARAVDRALHDAEQEAGVASRLVRRHMAELRADVLGRGSAFCIPVAVRSLVML